jgi:2-iminoacetate synthase
MSSFLQSLNTLDLPALFEMSSKAGSQAVEQSLAREIKTLEDFSALISPAASHYLESMAQASHRLTVQRFGRVIQLYAPLYVSNECVDTCTYCGFSRENEIMRLTLKPLEVLREARHLLKAGFRHILLVSGEHPKFTPPEYIAQIVDLLHKEIPSISLELAPQTEQVYREWVKAGAEGLVVYQETYQKEAYAEVHLAGKKKNYEWRLETPERGACAGMKRLGIGIWKCQITLSLPRIRPAAGGFQPKHIISDREFAQLICALRLFLPDAGIILSTRETPALR